MKDFDVNIHTAHVSKCPNSVLPVLDYARANIFSSRMRKREYGSGDEIGDEIVGFWERDCVIPGFLSFQNGGCLSQKSETLARFNLELDVFQLYKVEIDFLA